jgi:methyl-accepting chemotaxis protein
VKELAKQTARATDEIGRRIGTIQGDVKEAVTTIGEIGGIINRIHSYQNTIASAVARQTEVTRSISRNIDQAAKGSATIARSITGVAQAAATTSDGAQRTFRSAARLAISVTEMNELVAGAGRSNVEHRTSNVEHRT